MNGSEQNPALSLRKAAEELFQAECYCRAMATKLARTPRYTYSGKFYALRSKAEKEKEAAMNAKRAEAQQVVDAAEAYRREVFEYVQELKARDPETADKTFWFDCPFDAHKYSVHDGNPDHYSFPKGVFLETDTTFSFTHDLIERMGSRFDWSEEDYTYFPQEDRYYYTFSGLLRYNDVEEKNLLYRNDLLLSKNPSAGIKVRGLDLVNVENKSLSYQTFNVEGVKELSDAWAAASESAYQKRSAQLEQIERKVSERMTGVPLSAMTMFGMGMISTYDYINWQGEMTQDLNRLDRQYREARNADLMDYMQNTARLFNSTGSAYTRTHLSKGGVAAIGYIGDRLAFIELFPDSPLVEMDIPADTPLDKLGEVTYNRTVSKHYKGCDLGPVLLHLARYYGPLMGPFDPVEPKPVSWMPDWQWRLYCEERMIRQAKLNKLS